MRITLQVLLYKQKTYADGSHPVILQYIINRKAKRKVITRCKASDWDNKTNKVKSKVQNSARINQFIASELSKAEKDLYDIKAGDKSHIDLFRKSEKLTLDECFDLELARLEAEFKSGYYDKILAIRKQITKRDIYISLVDEKWFSQMIYDLTELGNSDNTIQKKIKLIRGMILRYSDAGVTREVKAIRLATTKPVKQKLTEAEVNALAALVLPEGDILTATRDIFLMQVYLRGIRIGDILQAKSHEFEDGRFTYVADKTGKQVSIKLIPKALYIVEKYKNKHDYLFPFFHWTPKKGVSKFENERERLKHKEVCTTIVNKHLKILAVMAGIKKPLTSHIARHTFARMAIDKINNPMITMELLGHSNMTVHQQYLKDVRNDDQLDKATDDIFG